MVSQHTPAKKWTIHVETRLKRNAASRFDTIRKLVRSYLLSHERINIPSTLDGWQDLPELSSAVDSIVVSESSCPLPSLTPQEMSLQIHVYQTCDSEMFEEFANGSSGGGEEDEVMAATVCELPNKHMEGLWDSLIYDGDIKLRLLDYIHATLLLSDSNVDFNLVSWNRVVLLHGPPGTGKTSLCRALAQKLAIRQSHRYPHARLLEINAHSLFSKWFSESGKLVQRLFSSITELVEEEESFVVVLIDEVESLTAARAGAMAGTEPSDGLRVVNALLTQIDKLKHRKNVLIMSTSNLVKAIDSAFVDRADIVQYVDNPSRDAVYNILRSCLIEVMDKGLISPVTLPSLKEIQMCELVSKSGAASTPLAGISPQYQQGTTAGLRLLRLAGECKTQGMSGRSLRRLPVLALAHYIGQGTAELPLSGSGGEDESWSQKSKADIDSWIEAMELAVKEHIKEHQMML